MNKNYNLAAKQRSHHSSYIEQRTARARRQFNEDIFRAPVILRFSYKGVIILKAENIYTVDKQIMISGTSPEMVDGKWSDGNQLKRNIDYMLESAKPERLAEVREVHRNWYCPNCKNVTLYDKDDEGETDGGFKYICCRCCCSDIFLDAVETASDEVMR
ncbi:hypothetical protein [Pantoea agglomerans]|uniref:hypothetical protein n=1 Tax=Enterobacter agglomerans TaxID=549 RepID=UPI00301D74B0